MGVGGRAAVSTERDFLRERERWSTVGERLGCRREMVEEAGWERLVEEER
jgi:hypothetical protein